MSIRNSKMVAIGFKTASILIFLGFTLSSVVFAAWLGTRTIMGDPPGSKGNRETIAAFKHEADPLPGVTPVKNDKGGVTWLVLVNVQPEPKMLQNAGKYKKETNAFLGPWDEYSYVFSITPLLIDMGRNDFQMGSVDNGINFDFIGHGNEVHTQWVGIGTDDAFLARDVNGNGVIDNGSELFGSGTDILFSETEGNSPDKAQDGYQALAQFDSAELGGNGDNKITRKDAVWSELLLWVDANANGLSEQNEISQVSDSILKKFRLKSKDTSYYDDQGNFILLWSWIKTNESTGPKRVKMVDVIFNQLDS